MTLLRLHSGARVALAAAGGALAGVPLAAAQQPAKPAAAAANTMPTVAPVAPAAGIAFKNVTVIDVTDGKRLTDHTVLVVGNRVKTLGPTDKVEIPKGAQVVDARGKYMIPGLWDMHVHAKADSGGGEVDDSSGATASPRTIYSLFIANGITGIRELAQRWEGGADSFRLWQRQIMAGTQIGPRGIGPSADLSEGNGLDIGTPQDAERVVDSLKKAGDAFAKFHGAPDDPEIFFAVMRAARRVGLPIVGHVPKSVTNVQAADSGMYGIEHNQVHHQCWEWPGPLSDSVDFERDCGPVADAYIRNGTWLTPTMTTHWLDPTPGARDPELWANTLKFWHYFYRKGVRNFISGTDWVDFIMNQYGREFWPGLSARDEVVFMAQMGMTPLEALQTATLNPAKFIKGTDSLGTVAPGKLADLVLLDADPLTDIANVLKLWAVVANGHYYDHATLLAIDPEGFRPGNGLVAWDRRLAEPSGSNAQNPSPPSGGATPAKRGP